LAGGLYWLKTRTDEATAAAEKHSEALAENARMAGISATAARDHAKEKLAEAQAHIKAAQAVLEEAQARHEASQMPDGVGVDQYGTGQIATLYHERQVVKSRQRLQQLIAQAVDWQLKLEHLEQKAQQETPRPRNPLDPTGTQGKQLAASNALLRDAVSRALAELERLNKDGELSVAAYYAGRQALQERAIALEIEQAQAELAVNKNLDQRRRLEERIEILQRNRADIAANTAREEARARAELEWRLSIGGAMTSSAWGGLI